MATPAIRIRSVALALATLLLPAAGGAQQPSAPSDASSSGAVSSGTSTLRESLRRAGTHELHIFYIHGMAANGSGDFDSWGLRKSICDHLADCTSAAGEMDGREYADQGRFALNAAPPTLKYLGQPVWRSAEEWHAAAPFVIHWKLARTSGASVYVDEINWWPLVFALKCREIVESESELVGPSEPYLSMCSKNEPDDPNLFPGRYRSYAWIPPEDAARLRALPEHGARLNRSWKGSLLDWGISDAVMAVGAMRPLFIDSIRQLILKSVTVEPSHTRGLADPAEQEFVVVTHSLGSYLVFSALDIRSGDVTAAAPESMRARFALILQHTSQVYFFANQVRLLELADLDTSGSETMLSHLQAWADLRMQYLKQAGRDDGGPPQIVAWNDPSDLLSWNVPPLASVSVRNIQVKNAPHWFWLFENPTKAHDRYAQNKKIIRQMMR